MIMLQIRKRESTWNVFDKVIMIKWQRFVHPYRCDKIYTNINPVCNRTSCQSGRPKKEKGSGEGSGIYLRLRFYVCAKHISDFQPNSHFHLYVLPENYVDHNVKDRKPFESLRHIRRPLKYMRVHVSGREGEPVCPFCCIYAL